MQNLFLVILLCLLNLKTAFAADFIVGLKAFKAQDYDTAFEELKAKSGSSIFPQIY